MKCKAMKGRCVEIATFGALCPRHKAIAVLALEKYRNKYPERLKEAQRKYHATPKGAANRKKSHRAQQFRIKTDPKYAAKVRNRNRASEQIRYKTDPKVRERKIASNKRMSVKPEYKQKQYFWHRRWLWLKKMQSIRGFTTQERELNEKRYANRTN